MLLFTDFSGDIEESRVDWICLFWVSVIEPREWWLVVRGSERKSSMETTKLIETLLLSWILFLLCWWTRRLCRSCFVWQFLLSETAIFHDYQAMRALKYIGKWRSINEINQNIFSLKTSAVVFLLWKLSPQSILMMPTRMSKKVARILLMDFKITGIQVIKSNWNGERQLV